MGCHDGRQQQQVVVSGFYRFAEPIMNVRMEKIIGIPLWVGYIVFKTTTGTYHIRVIGQSKHLAVRRSPPRVLPRAALNYEAGST